MTTYPRATYRPLESTQGQSKMAAHNIICLHTMVGYLTSTDRMFHAHGWTGTESHFGIGGKWGDGLDGVVYQWQDTEFRADANLEGNGDVLSIETGDNAPRLAADIEPWTEKQIDAIVLLVTYLCRTYSIPAVLIPDTKPGRRGIAYHRQGVQHSGGTHPDGFLQPGGRKWSTATGKECPGPARIAQIPGIIKRVQGLLNPTKGTPVSEPTDPFRTERTLTAADASAYGGAAKPGDKKSRDEFLRFPPATERARRENATLHRELLAGIKAQHKTLTDDVGDGNATLRDELAAVRLQLTDLQTSVAALIAHLSER